MCQWNFQVPTFEECELRNQQIDARGEYETTGVEPVDDSTTYYAVVCSLCQTRMYALPEQVGTELTCPDCETKTIVTAPAPKVLPEELSPEELAKRQDEYAIFDGIDQPALTEKVVYQTYLARNCPLCDTRLLATEDQVGHQIECPDCGELVEMPPIKESLPVMMEVTPEDEYESGAPIDTSGIDHTPFRRETQLKRKLPRWFESPPSKFPPISLFLSGVFTFPFYSGVWQRWLLLSVLAVLEVYLLLLALSTWSILRVSLIGFSSFLGIIWVCISNATLLTILEETAEGNKTVEHWPGPVWVDWFLDSFFFINSFVYSILPGTLLVRFVDFGVFGWLVSLVLTVILFPVVLMSMLEMGTCLEPLSWPVVRSFLTATKAWLVFYVESSLLLAGTLLIFLIVLVTTNLFFLFVSFPIYIAAMIVYFRILGRFAWYGSRENP